MQNNFFTKICIVTKNFNFDIQPFCILIKIKYYETITTH